ncbi:ATP-binding protein [Streptomyces telluris]|uniref:ATP-binding protein n=1 Tax=Streptomyces telluris TaxID=2720021 RepID=A0A9X2LP90_9ACTN|nr:ATP-binding protein [Streptomyces telluris]MCQ8774517.1 ATP-binding protein [Streptomyces telluris]NJP81236.1 ATP-binding protein [Streptomyces telluris]
MRRVLTTVAMAAAALTFGSATAAQAAGSAPSPDLGGLAAIDPGSLGKTVDGAVQKATRIAGDAGSKVVKKAVPMAGKAAGGTVRHTTAAAQRTVGRMAGSAGSLVGEAAKSAARGGQSAHARPTGPLPMKKV